MENANIPLWLEARLNDLVALYPGNGRNTDHVIINALSDLRHLAALHGVDFLYCDTIAYQIHLQENQAGKEGNSLPAKPPRHGSSED